MSGPGRIEFPNPQLLEDLHDTPGLKIIGGDVSDCNLKRAYASGYFPWNDENDPTLWFCPNPRFVLFPEELYLGKTNKKAYIDSDYHYSYNQEFEKVLRHCQTIYRPGQGTTWLSDILIENILKLHHGGLAFSVEAYRKDQLIGGFYGIHPEGTKVFCGESMFSLVPGASKMAFIWFCQNICPGNYALIDCQQESHHIKQLGGRFIELDHYQSYLNT